MKFDTYDHKIVNDHHIKFHEYLSFCCGDISKTILVFFKLQSNFYKHRRLYIYLSIYMSTNYAMISLDIRGSIVCMMIG